MHLDVVCDIFRYALGISTTCQGMPSRVVLTYDNEGRLSGWQNTPTSPTTTDSFLYDGEGNRVEQQTITSGAIITSTVYVAGGLEEITTSGASTTLTKYFGAAGLPTAERVGTNGPLSYLASDGQGTVSETLDGSGNITSAQLYTPYGSVRYSSGSSPTSLGYTGQRSDATTGLDYYHARYYDPMVGQFASADTVQDGLNRYGYVAGNPTTATDPSGHRRMCEEDCGTPPGSSGGGGGDCHSDRTCGCYTDCGGNGNKPDPKECGTYTQEQCDQARTAQLAAISDARRSAGLWQLLIGLFGIVVDFISLSVDFGELSLNAVIDVGTDIAGIAADLGVTLEATGNLLASFFGDNDNFDRMRQAGQTLATVGGNVKAGLAAVKANTGFWVNVAKATLYATLLAGSAVFAGAFVGTEELIDAVGDAVLQAIRSIGVTDWKQLVNMGIGLLQTKAADQSTHADDLAGETPFGFCTSADATAACPQS